MRTWIPGSTIGTAVVARDSLDQLLQTALVAHLLALVDGGHVCPVEESVYAGRWEGIQLLVDAVVEVWMYQGQGLKGKPRRSVVCSGRSVKQHWDNCKC